MLKAFKESDYDLALDAKSEPNRNTWFVPAGMSLDGEVRMEWVRSSTIPGAIAQVGGVIPGHRMLVDTKLKHVKIFDRLSLPENKRIVDELRKLTQTERYWHARFDSLRQDVDFNLTDDEWPKWLYCMRRCVDHGTLHLLRGTLPSEQECRRMGPMTFNNGNGISPKDSANPFNVLKPPALENSAKPGLATAGAK